VVYLAHDLKHDRKVALKVIRPDLILSGMAERFTREIRLAARLQHAHILPVHDSGESAGQLWYTMPFVEGESLRDRLARDGRLPARDALRIAREASQALAYAHEHGVVHRDIKPENILLARDGSVLVADFGIARAIAGSTGAPAASTATQLTEVGVVIGTPAYMSPEQAMGESGVDGRTDIYAVGVMLYEMVAGQPPFAGPSGPAILARSLTEMPPSLTSSPVLDAIVAKALARDPADRFPTAQALLDALDQVRGEIDTTRTGTAVVPPPRRGRRVVAIAAALFLIVAAVLWFRPRPKHGSSDQIRIAVLPFVNRGAAEDAYFPDGMADELRGKLAGLAGFRITARASSDQYRESTKTPTQIGRELGVGYLLTATVRWARSGDGKSRVQVVPELVRVETGEIAWQRPFEADLTDIFQVQATIAGEVASALGAVLGAGESHDLAAQPTRNLAAYDLFLRAGAVRGSAREKVRARVDLLEQAVALDSTFSRAWALLSNSLSSLYANAAPDPAIALRALSSAERAIRTGPKDPAGYDAMANYHYAVTRDADRAEQQILRGLELAPHDPEILATAAKIERQTGQFEAAVDHLRQAMQLNPRSVTTLNVLQTTLLWLRRYPEALAISDSLLTLRPGDLGFSQDKAMVYLAEGRLPDAKALIASLSPALPDSEVAAYFSYYWDMYWVLDDAEQRLVLRLGPASFDNERAAWATSLMQLYWLRGDKTRARAYADTAYAENAALMRESPDDAQLKVLAGLALAYLGRGDEAIALGLRGTALAPLKTDKINGPYYQHQLARIYLLAGRPEQALDQLEPLLQTPYYLSPGWLRLDPTFASLAGTPRYDQLLRRQ
ncbi:MAG: protein kinase, partial [Gemmatimonadota bacterium]